jgi:hypothetical protein
MWIAPAGTARVADGLVIVFVVRTSHCLNLATGAARCWLARAKLDVTSQCQGFDNRYYGMPARLAMMCLKLSRDQ